jgi:hypothetical protein
MAEIIDDPTILITPEVRRASYKTLLSIVPDAATLRMIVKLRIATTILEAAKLRHIYDEEVAIEFQVVEDVINELNEEKKNVQDSKS